MITLLRQYCENEHVRFGCAYTEEVAREDAEKTILETLEFLEVDPWCRQCGSRTFHFDHWQTLYATMEEAEAYLRNLQDTYTAEMPDEHVRQLAEDLYDIQLRAGVYGSGEPAAPPLPPSGSN